jgi:diaminopimelate epimerase
MALQNKDRIPFFKMTGSGNDFILIDNRDLKLSSDNCRGFVLRACRRKLSVGADGLILIENDPEADFMWRFFNADGSEAEMCGNGARCAARFAYIKGIVDKPRLAFRTIAGIVEAEITGERVKVLMPRPRDLETDLQLHVEERPFSLSFINTGVPHAVIFTKDQEDLDKEDVFRWGRALRYHPRFQPAGSNVNFVCLKDSHRILIRTYERGVEEETLACGTGSIASALVAASKQLAGSPVELQTRSGENLTVYFKMHSNQGKVDFGEVYLEGDAKVVYEAELWDETVKE